MLLTLTTTHEPATDLGYLLHKHPARCQSFTLPFGQAHVYYPEASATRCTAALVLDVDPVGLVRDARGATISQYVNDRPYVASSLLSVALARVYGSALNGRCKDRPELAQTAIPLHARLAALPCAAGEDRLRRLFEPLGYAVTATQHPMDPVFPAWGASPYFTVELTHTICLDQLLSHLYVLMPVLDGAKHYWVGEEEVEKLLRQGEGWLADHPERDYITQRYLKYRKALARAALSRLTTPDEAQDAEAQDAEEAAVERPLSLHDQRLDAVLEVLVQTGATSVLDLGCGEGRLLHRLWSAPQFTRIVGVDVSHRALERAQARLRLDRQPEAQRRRVELHHGSLVYRDRRLTGFDAAALVEVVEHLDPPRLAAFARSVFGEARPRTVVLTTPNREYNARFETLPAGQLRHRDHRFEWTRAEFEAWAHQVAEAYGYTVDIRPVGPEDPALGAPTQMGVFDRRPASPNTP
ncbi:MAG: 3' terminal RNA ribose 2'-O-methyltransferase Hen1 [Bacteroidota bacterium]